MAIHPTAIVHPDARLGSDVEIGPYCSVGPQVQLGDRTRLLSHVVLQGDTWLGADNEVFPFAVIGVVPQDKKLKGESPPAPLRIGSRNKIREHVTIHGGTTFGCGVTTIGDDNMLLVGSHVGHDATIHNGVVLTNGALVAGHALIEDRAILGAMAGVHQFARVGRLAMVGGGAMVSQDAPPFAMVQGDRARLVGVNLVGLHRAGMGTEQVGRIKRAYRQLFWRAGSLAERSELLRNGPLGADDDVRAILDFIDASTRGLCMPRARRQGRNSSERDEADAGQG